MKGKQNKRRTLNNNCNNHSSSNNSQNMKKDTTTTSSSSSSIISCYWLCNRKAELKVYTDLKYPESVQKGLCSILGTFGYPVKLGTFSVKLGTPVIVKLGT